MLELIGEFCRLGGSDVPASFRYGGGMGRFQKTALLTSADDR